LSATREVYPSTDTETTCRDGKILKKKETGEERKRYAQSEILFE
jgi:hypothetical protein